MKNNLLGTEFEISLRVLILLDELESERLDVHQIACIDFMAIYGADFNILDENLNGNGMFRASEFSNKYILVSSAVKKLAYGQYINLSPSNDGYLYSINIEGKDIAKKINNTYSSEYRVAVYSVKNKYPDLDAHIMESIILNKSVEILDK